MSKLLKTNNLLILILLLTVGCDQSKTNSYTLKSLDKDSIISLSIMKEMDNFISEDNRLPDEHRIYSVYLKNYFNLTTLYINREYYADSLLIEKADEYYLHGTNLILIFNGMNNLNTGKHSSLFTMLKKSGFNLNWDGKIVHFSGIQLYVSRGEILKIDTSVSTDFNFCPIPSEIIFTPPK